MIMIDEDLILVLVGVIIIVSLFELFIYFFNKGNYKYFKKAFSIMLFQEFF